MLRPTEMTTPRGLENTWISTLILKVRYKIYNVGLFWKYSLINNIEKKNLEFITFIFKSNTFWYTDKPTKRTDVLKEAVYSAYEINYAIQYKDQW